MIVSIVVKVFVYVLGEPLGLLLSCDEKVRTLSMIHLLMVRGIGPAALV